MDENEDGIVDMDEYTHALDVNPQLFQWFNLLNQGPAGTEKKNKNDMQ